VQLTEIPGTERAVEFATKAYRTRLERKDRTIEHPLAVARLLADDDQPPATVLAGLLHDVLEDTTVTDRELDEAFGEETARVVAALTQDPSIKKYRARKGALRRQILDAGPTPATVSLADKAAKLRSLRSRPERRKLDHYRQTLSGIERHYGSSRLSALLRQELERWSPDGS
jgi:guanosine-3',5'-bis(diphosphate) 3'-pyrophosphohydrolase